MQYPQQLMLHSTRFARLLTVFRKFFNYPLMSETFQGKKFQPTFTSERPKEVIGVGGEGGYFLQFLFTCFRTESNTFTAAEGCFLYRGLLILKLKTVRIFYSDSSLCIFHFFIGHFFMPTQGGGHAVSPKHYVD